MAFGHVVLAESATTIGVMWQLCEQFRDRKGRVFLKIKKRADAEIEPKNCIGRTTIDLADGHVADVTERVIIR